MVSAIDRRDRIQGRQAMETNWIYGDPGGISAVHANMLVRPSSLCTNVRGRYWRGCGPKTKDVITFGNPLLEKGY